MYDTIAAIATTLSSSAISIIRVSGNDAINIVDKIFSGSRNILYVLMSLLCREHYSQKGSE